MTYNPSAQYGKKIRVADSLSNRDYTAAGIKARKPGAVGTICDHSDGHGLCFKVAHEEGSFGWYDPDEFVIVE